MTMVQEINFTELGNELILRFGGKHNRMSVETFTGSIIEITSAVNEINRIVYPKYQLNLYINAIGRGSFLTGLELQEARKDMTTIDDVDSSYTLSLLGVALITGGNFRNLEFNFKSTENSLLIENKNRKLILPKQSTDSAKQALNSVVINNHISRNYSYLSADREVKSLALINNLDEKDQVFKVTRENIENFAVKPETLEKSKKRERELLIVRAAFKRNRMWRFMTKEGKEFSAKILDENFMDDLISNKYAVGVEDKLQVILRTNTYLDQNTFRHRKRYEIVKVINHTLSN